MKEWEGTGKEWVGTGKGHGWEGRGLKRRFKGRK